MTGRLTRLDHVGITVEDLERAVAFFVGLGLEVEGRAEIEGAFIDTVLGMQGAHTEIAMLRPPGGGTALELARFIHPPTRPGAPDAPPNVVGIQNLGYEVDDLAAIVERLGADGYHPIGAVGRYEDQWLMAHIRGPEGIVVSISQRIG